MPVERLLSSLLNINKREKVYQAGKMRKARFSRGSNRRRIRFCFLPEITMAPAPDDNNEDSESREFYMRKITIFGIALADHLHSYLIREECHVNHWIWKTELLKSDSLLNFSDFLRGIFQRPRGLRVFFFPRLFRRRPSATVERDSRSRTNHFIFYCVWSAAIVHVPIQFCLQVVKVRAMELKGVNLDYKGPNGSYHTDHDCHCGSTDQ